ncbi:MAG TPA: mannosyltransferase family protein, partial [Ktedonobacteraceae bacterium]|nr:mannosyltransferase family protein [Ktedonobacteraceae bacterium]
MKRTPYREILWLFIITRLLLVIVTYFGYILFTAANYTSTPVNVAGLLTSWNHWDAANYVRIAQYGYQSRFDLAFFPLFPLMISLIAHVLGSWSYLLAGTLISNGALLAALFVIYQLAADVAGDEVAHRTLLYLCIFPTALFFFAAYNESLFILLTAGAFLAMRRQRWWLVGILGFFAALTRAAGVLLVVP